MSIDTLWTGFQGHESIWQRQRNAFTRSEELGKKNPSERVSRSDPSGGARVEMVYEVRVA